MDLKKLERFDAELVRVADNDAKFRLEQSLAATKLSESQKLIEFSKAQFDELEKEFREKN